MNAYTLVSTVFLFLKQQKYTILPINILIFLATTEKQTTIRKMHKIQKTENLPTCLDG